MCQCGGDWTHPPPGLTRINRGGGAHFYVSLHFGPERASAKKTEKWEAKIVSKHQTPTSGQRLQGGGAGPRKSTPTIDGLYCVSWKGPSVKGKSWYETKSKHEKQFERVFGCTECSLGDFLNRRGSMGGVPPASTFSPGSADLPSAGGSVEMKLEVRKK